MDSKSLHFSQLEVYSRQYLHSLSDNQSFLKRLCLTNKLNAHTGCVNTICWSDLDPSIILSGSDDQNLSVTNAFTGKRNTLISTNHRTNIFCAKFLPFSNDNNIVSCSSGGDIYLNNINSSGTNLFKCHGDKTCYEIRCCSKSTFFSCGQDGCVKLIDLRQYDKCEKNYCQEHTLIKISNGITAISINPVIPYHLSCGGLDGILRIYDTRMLSIGCSDSNQLVKGLFAVFNPPSQNNLSLNGKRITSVQYDRSGSEILVSYQPNSIYLLDWRDLAEEKEILNETTSDSSMPNHENSESTSSNERKFRIQSDWSDTGPNSIAFNEMTTDDPRAFLARRLSEWFSNMANSRGSHRSILNLNRPNSIESIETQPNHVQSNNQEEINELSNDSAEDDKNENESEQNKKKENFLNLTTSIFGSRIRTKHALRLENKIIKDKPSPRIRMVFTGHRNTRTIIKECNFWGNDHVISGSDCGHVFFWNKNSAEIVNIIEADKRVVNCVQENPNFPFLATSGIDHDVKVWQPTLSFPNDDKSKIEKVIKRNKIMLEENKNTMFIPVQFMLPALRLFGANMSVSTRSQTENSN